MNDSKMSGASDLDTFEEKSEKEKRREEEIKNYKKYNTFRKEPMKNIIQYVYMRQLNKQQKILLNFIAKQKNLIVLI